MGRERVPGAKGSVHRQVHGLKIIERNLRLYITGTLRVDGRSHRVRKSTGLDSRLPENWEHAGEIRNKTERDLTREVIHGVKPRIFFASVAGSYLQSSGAGVADKRNADELIARFGADHVTKITRDRIEKYYAARFKGAAPATIRRHMTTLHSILAHAVKGGYLSAVPYWEKPKVSRRRGRGAVKMFHPGEAEYLIEAAAPHAKPIFAVLHATGARVGMTLWLPKENFILVPDRGRVFFPESKNGNAYSRPLSDFAVRILQGWLGVRRDRRPEMFLTPKGLPYAKRSGMGGHCQASFGHARARLVAKLIEMGREDRARVVAQATPHWFRHNLANWLRAAGASSRDIAEAGMWESERLVNDTYVADAPAHVEEVLKSLPFGRNLTQTTIGAEKDEDKSGS